MFCSVRVLPGRKQIAHPRQRGQPVQRPDNTVPLGNASMSVCLERGQPEGDMTS